MVKEKVKLSYITGFEVESKKRGAILEIQHEEAAVEAPVNAT
jgi:hypothetical protein